MNATSIQYAECCIQGFGRLSACISAQLEESVIERSVGLDEVATTQAGETAFGDDNVVLNRDAEYLTGAD